WNSGRVLDLARRVLDYAPDLVIVYASHNELAGRAMEEGPAALPAGEVATVALHRSALIAWLHRGAAALRSRSRGESLPESQAALAMAAAAPNFDPMLLSPEERRRPSAELEREAAARYSRNLTELAASAHDAGVPAVFVLPVANLWYPPSYLADEG